MANGVITEREREVWSLISKGLNNAGISEILFIDYKTVERHVTTLISKTMKYRIGLFHPRTWLALNYHLCDLVGKLEHGDKMECPSCGASGRFDLMLLGLEKNEAEFDDAIWLSRHGNSWECYECYLK